MNLFKPKYIIPYFSFSLIVFEHTRELYYGMKGNNSKITILTIL